MMNVFITHATSTMHENINGRIQNAIAKEKGLRYQRCRINMLFPSYTYFNNKHSHKS